MANDTLTSPKVTALIMAGKRSGQLDPLAARAGVSQKAVVPVLGVPMVERVAKEVAACEHVGQIRIVAHETDEIAALPAIARLIEEGRLTFAEGQHNLVDSVFSGAEGIDFPMIITTADNCLVTAEGYSEFITQCIAKGAGAGLALARKEDVIAADPEGQKLFYQFRDGEFSNCNLYWMESQQALSSVEIMRGGGQFVKFPLRIIKAFGLMSLIRFRLGTGSKEKLFEQASGRFGTKLVPIELSNGQYAIDVDEQRSFNVTERLLKQREDAVPA